MSQPELYGVYVASFPFLEVNEEKFRPVIVVSRPYSQHNVIAVIPITAKGIAESVDVKLIGWSESGLSRPSIVRTHRLSTLETHRLGTMLGLLTTEDKRQLKSSLRKFLSL